MEKYYFSADKFRKVEFHDILLEENEEWITEIDGFIVEEYKPGRYSCGGYIVILDWCEKVPNSDILIGCIRQSNEGYDF